MLKHTFYCTSAKIEDPVSIVKYDPATKGLITYTYENLYTQLPASVGYWEFHRDEDAKSKPKMKTMRDWFVNNVYTQYRFTSNVQKPISYTENDVHYINQFAGFRWQTFREPTRWEQQGIDMFWNHVNEVSCSGRQHVYQYSKLWICHMIDGRKMRTILCQIGDPGAGKSVVASAVRETLGSKIAYLAGSARSLTGGFNGELAGKIFVVYEELKSRKEEWGIMMNQLKTMATEDVLDINRKHKECYNTKNTLSIMIISNYGLKMDTGDRKFVMTDISHHKTDDKEYFDKLHEYLKDPGWQEAFFWSCEKFAQENSKFDELAEAKKLDTKTKSDTIIDNLALLFKYIKSEFVLKRRDFNIFLDQLTNRVNDLNADRKGEPLSNIKVSSILKGLGITCTRSTGGKNRYNVLADDLLKIYTKKKWIHEIDEFEEEDQAVQEAKATLQEKCLNEGVNFTDKSVDVKKLLMDEDMKMINRLRVIMKRQMEHVAKQAKFVDSLFLKPAVEDDEVDTDLDDLCDDLQSYLMENKQAPTRWIASAEPEFGFD